MSNTRVDPVTRAAVDWMLRLESGQACPSERQVFKAWLAESPEHMAAWQRVAGVLKTPLADLQAVERRSPGQLHAAREALLASPSAARKKALQGGLLLLLLGVGAAGMVDRVTPLRGMMADQHTATGERRTIELADGSRLTLNARSAVDIQFSAGQRRVQLREGQLQVDVAADPQRPFVVATAQGQVKALGTRFMVRQGRTKAWPACNSAACNSTPSMVCNDASMPVRQCRLPPARLTRKPRLRAVRPIGSKAG